MIIKSNTCLQRANQSYHWNWNALRLLGEEQWRADTSNLKQNEAWRDTNTTQHNTTLLVLVLFSFYCHRRKTQVSKLLLVINTHTHNLYFSLLKNLILGRINNNIYHFCYSKKFSNSIYQNKGFFLII